MTGDMELDAMDSYDVSDDMYESDTEESYPDSLESSKDEVSAVADILLGGSGEGHEPKGKRTGFRTHDLDNHGNIDHRDGARQEAPQKSDPLTEQERVSVSEHNQQLEQIAQADEWIRGERAKAQAAYERGETTWEQFQAREYELGGAYGQLSMAAKDWEIQQYKMKDEREQSYRTMQDRLGDRWSPENRGETAKQAVEFLTSRNIDPSLVMDIDSPDVACTVIEAMDAINQADTLKAENAALKAQVRNLKKMRGQGRKQGRKGSQTGSVDKQSAMIDEVAALLSGGK